MVLLEEIKNPEESQRFYIQNAECLLRILKDFVFLCMPDEDIFKVFDISPEDLIAKLCNIEMWMCEAIKYPVSSFNNDKIRAILEDNSIAKELKSILDMEVPKDVYSCCDNLLDFVMEYQREANLDIDSYTETKKYDFLDKLWFKKREFSSFLEEIKNPTEDQKVSIRIAKKIIEDCMNNIYWSIKGRCPDEFYDCLLAGIEPTNKKILKGIFEMNMWIRRVIFNIKFSIDSSEIITFIETNKMI